MKIEARKSCKSSQKVEAAAYTIEKDNDGFMTVNSGRTGARYSIHYNEDIDNFSFSMSKLSPYDDAEYFWAKYQNGQLAIIKDRTVYAKVGHFSIDEDSDINEEIDAMIQVAVGELDDRNRDIKKRIIHNSEECECEDKDEITASAYDLMKQTTSEDHNNISMLLRVPDSGHIYRMRIRLDPFYVYMSRRAAYDDADYAWLESKGNNLVISNQKGKLRTVPMDVTVPVYDEDDPDAADGDGQDGFNTAVDYLTQQCLELLESANQDVEPKIINNSEKITSAKEVDMQDLGDEIRVAVERKVHDVMVSADFGFPEEEVKQYSTVDAYFAQDSLIIEVRAEVSYEGLVELCDKCNPIVQTYDSESYFDCVQPGIIQAWLDCDTLKSIESSTEVEAAEDTDFDPDEFNNDEVSDHDKDIASQIKAEVEAGVAEFMLGLGFDSSDINEYTVVETEFIGAEQLKVEVRAEVSYNSLVNLAESINEIVQDYDEDSYFDAEDTGIINAFLRVDRIRDNYAEQVEGAYDLPPDDNPLQSSSESYELELALSGVEVIVSDISYDYVNEDFVDNELPSDEDTFMFDDKIEVADHDQVIEALDDLLYNSKSIPNEPGKYRMEGTATLHWDIDRSYYYEDDDWSDEVYQVSDPDYSEVKLNLDKSHLDHFQITKIE